MWLSNTEKEEKEGQQFNIQAPAADPVQRTLAFWSMAFFVLFSFVASLLAHSLVKSYLKAALVIGFGFAFASLVGYCFSAVLPPILLMVVAVVAKGLVALLIALVVGLPFLYMRQKD
ncbi:hypothetical protein A7E78_06855 [Syntrophotalea acetylenivorans]|uniref:Uncharacterized protein n=2 Tax=Syntrophotalea acetylenivorans TaxID=1842532 RepID=A0A1L3GPH7_9BACT|nr:hypothetical protein A7E78_06855 [Syntrophotalea acetylenivorans]